MVKDEDQKNSDNVEQPGAAALGPVDPAAFPQMQTALAEVLEKLEAKIDKLRDYLVGLRPQM